MTRYVVLVAATALVIYALRQAEVLAADPQIRRGIEWLKTNQRADGHWWTQSLRNSPNTPNFLTHAGTTFALKALAITGAIDDEPESPAPSP